VLFRSILTIGMVLLVALLSVMPALAVAEQADWNTVDLYIKGGFGITLGVKNHKDQSVTAKYHILEEFRGTRDGTFSAGSDEEGKYITCGCMLQPVTVSVSCCGKTLTRNGFTLFLTTIFFDSYYS